MYFFARFFIKGGLVMNKTELTYSYGDKDFFACFPKRKEHSHKGTYGQIGVIAGSKGMAGAAFLCARAAYAVGTGLVRIYTHEANRVVLQQLLPEAIVVTYEKFDQVQLFNFMKLCDVIAIGCGLGQSTLSEKIVRYTMEQAKCSCVVDADAINIIAKDLSIIKNAKQPLALTPHMKEMSRLLKCSVDELEKKKMQYLQEFSDSYHITCVLKDSRTLVYTTGKGTYFNTTGNSAMAKAGAGDVLTGIIAGIVGQKASIHDSAWMGVYLHGKAGDIARDKLGPYSVMARDIIEAISIALK